MNEVNKTADDANVPDTNIAAEAPAAWKPEPRVWLWSDIFKAPMIACKFRCMLVSIVTIAAMGLVSFIFNKIPYDTYAIQVIGPVLSELQCIIPCIIFGLGGTFVAIFIKAELLDDDYPTFAEALAQFKKRIVAAAMVPLFLVGTLKFLHLGAYLYALLCSIPFVGSILYFASIPSFFIWILITFFSIAVFLGMFVFPAIVAIRKHGWFDNVIDTLEAVGTKPHKVIASILMTGLLMLVCCGIGITALYSAKGLSSSPHLFGHEVANTEAAADVILQKTIPAGVSGIIEMVRDSKGPLSFIGGNASGSPTPEEGGIPGYHQYFTGALAGIFQTVVIYLIAGLGLNIIITGGMLTYLHVREDDYWDDEDLADLEKLAKELEDEALKEQDASKPVAASESVADVKTEDKSLEERKATTATVSSSDAVTQESSTTEDKPDATEVKTDDNKADDK